MKNTTLQRRAPLRARKSLRIASPKTIKRNADWRIIIMNRAVMLAGKYGFIICEYSGEPITTLSSAGADLNDGWGHHIDGNRNNCTPENCYIVKYKHHRLIEDNNIQVKQEGFEGLQWEKGISNISIPILPLPPRNKSGVIHHQQEDI